MANQSLIDFIESMKSSGAPPSTGADANQSVLDETSKAMAETDIYKTQTPYMTDAQAQQMTSGVIDVNAPSGPESVANVVGAEYSELGSDSWDEYWESKGVNYLTGSDYIKLGIAQMFGDKKTIKSMVSKTPGFDFSEETPDGRIVYHYKDGVSFQDNALGPSWVDAAQLVGQEMKELPATLLASGGKLAWRIAKMAGLGFSTDVIDQYANQYARGQKEFALNPAQAGLNALAFGVGEWGGDVLSKKIAGKEKEFEDFIEYMSRVPDEKLEKAIKRADQAAPGTPFADVVPDPGVKSDYVILKQSGLDKKETLLDRMRGRNLEQPSTQAYSLEEFQTQELLDLGRRMIRHAGTEKEVEAVSKKGFEFINNWYTKTKELQYDKITEAYRLVKEAGVKVKVDQPVALINQLKEDYTLDNAKTDMIVKLDKALAFILPSKTKKVRIGENPKELVGTIEPTGGRITRVPEKKIEENLVQEFTQSDPSKVDKALQEIEAIIKQSLREGKGYSRDLIEIKKSIKSALEEATGQVEAASGVYRKARSKIESMERGITGDLLNLDENDIASFTKIIFNPIYAQRAGHSFEEFNRVRDLFSNPETGNRRLWLNMTADFIGRNIRMVPSEEAEDLTVAGVKKLFDVGGTNNARRAFAITESALEPYPDVAKEFKKFTTMLRFSGSTSRLGSPTATRNKRLQDMGVIPSAESAQGYIKKGGSYIGSKIEEAFGLNPIDTEVVARILLNPRSVYRPMLVKALEERSFDKMNLALKRVVRVIPVSVTRELMGLREGDDVQLPTFGQPNTEQLQTSGQTIR